MYYIYVIYIIYTTPHHGALRRSHPRETSKTFLDRPQVRSHPRETSKTFFKRRSRDKQNLLYPTLERQAKPFLPSTSLRIRVYFLGWV